MCVTKEVTVICANKTKLVKINFQNLECTKELLKKKFNLPTLEFDLKAVSGEKGEEYDIDDEEDLERFKNSEKFYIRPRHHEACAESYPASPVHAVGGTATGSTPPPTYEQSIQSPSKKEEPATTERFTVDCRGRKKSVEICRSSVGKTREAISRRFSLEGRFKLQARLPTGDVVDIDDEDDVDELQHAEALVIPEEDSVFSEAPAQPQPPEEKVSVNCRGSQKFVGIYRSSVEMTKDAVRRRFSIEGDFKLQAKLKGDLIDIDDEEDVEELQQAEGLVVPVDTSDGAAKGNRSLVPAGAASKAVADQLKGMEICAVQTETTVVVEIDRNKYALTKAPPIKSPLVVMEIQNLRMNFDIEGILRQIEIVATCLRVVLYGVVSKRDLELKVVEVQAKVERLCNVSGNAVKRFGMKANVILTDMQHGIRSLMDGYWENASEHFQKIATVSDEMKKTAEDLTEALSTLEKAVKDMFADVTRANTAHMDTVEGTRTELAAEITKGEKALLEQKIQQAKRDLDAADKRIDTMPTGDDKTRVKSALDKGEYKAKTDAATEAKETAAISKAAGLRRICPAGVCCSICCKGGLLCAHQKRRVYKSDAEDAEYRLLDREKADRAEALKERERLRKAEEDAIKELLQYTESMKKVDPSNEPEDLIENSLRGAERALKTLGSALSAIILFWEDMKLQADSITSAGSGSVDKMGGDMDEKAKEEFFKGRSFQVSAVEYLAKWVAMRTMCEAFTKALRPIQAELQSSISDTPSRQQAFKRIPELIMTLDKKLASRNADLCAEETSERAELDALMAAGADE